MVTDAAGTAALEGFLAREARAERASVRGATLLSGGTLQENWRLEVEFAGGALAGPQLLVLRATRPGGMPDSLSRREEFTVVRAVHAAGVTVPEPLWYSPAGEVLETEFFVARFVAGIASPNRIVRERQWGGDPVRLVERLGEEVARMQTVVPGHPGLEFLDAPRAGAVAHQLAQFRRYLDEDPASHPAIEWGMRWLERNAPPPGRLVLTHGDFRTGNYMVDRDGLTGILDWELASWGDPLLDLGWFCMKFWRWGANGLAAGGLAQRDDLFRGYERIAGHRVDRDEAMYWETLANLRWAVLAIQQAQRHLSGSAPSLELALTGRCTAEMEYEFLQLMRGRERTAAGRAAAMRG